MASQTEHATTDLVGRNLGVFNENGVARYVVICA